MSRRGNVFALFSDVAVHARSAAPLLVLADLVCARQLGIIVNHFVAAGLVGRSSDRASPRRRSTRRLVRSPTARGVVVGLAWLAVLAIALSQRSENLPDWSRPDGIVPMFSPAGW